MRFQIRHLLLAMTAAAVTLVVLKRSEPPKTTPIVVAAVDLYRGTKIEPEFLELKEWPKDLAPKGALTRVGDAVDRRVASSMVKGEPLFARKVTDKGNGVGLFVKPSMRAFTISTPTVRNAEMSGMLLPSMRVDVLLTLSRGRGAGALGGTTSTLLQHVEILAVDQKRHGKGQSGIQNVTLLVTPDEAAQLTHAWSMGTLSVALRPSDSPPRPIKRREKSITPSKLPGDLLWPPGGAPPDQGRPPLNSILEGQQSADVWPSFVVLIQPANRSSFGTRTSDSIFPL